VSSDRKFGELTADADLEQSLIEEVILICYWCCVITGVLISP